MILKYPLTAQFLNRNRFKDNSVFLRSQTQLAILRKYDNLSDK